MRRTNHGHRIDLIGNLLEHGLHFGIERSGLQADRQRIRQIGLQDGQVETVQIQIQMAFMGFRERPAVTVKGQRGTVDIGRKGRFDQYIGVIRQAGNEGQRQVDVADGMQLALGLIVKNDLGVDQLDIVQREARRLARRLILGLHPLVEQVGNVVAPLRHTGYRHPQALQADFVDHGGQLEDGGR